VRRPDIIAVLGVSPFSRLDNAVDHDGAAESLNHARSDRDIVAPDERRVRLVRALQRPRLCPI
jgi:hypothetical protein